jgi:hypothetical protein
MLIGRFLYRRDVVVVPVDAVLKFRDAIGL